MRARSARAFLVLGVAFAVIVSGIGSTRADDAERIARIRERAILAADVLRVARLAEACGQRDAAWAARVRRMVIARQEEDAVRLADEVQGGREAIRWLMLGTRIAADAAADAEHSRYGEAACSGVDTSGDLVEVDRFLAAEPG